MQLLGKPVAEKISQNIRKYISENSLTDVYIVDFCLNKNDDSTKYVQMKGKYAETLGVNMIGKYEYTSLEDIYESIDKYNQDPKCLGMLFQLPLPPELKPSQKDILEKINPNKDIDGHTSSIFGFGAIGYGDILPATAAAVVNILDFYELGNVSGKNILVIGQSNVIGKPLNNLFINKGATVISANIYTDRSKLIEYCQFADIIISATGDLGYLGDRYIYTDRSQILIDIGFGLKDGKICGDIDFDKINLTNKTYTPVPGGVGPVTIASLFDNIVKLNSHK